MRIIRDCRLLLLCFFLTVLSCTASEIVLYDDSLSNNAFPVTIERGNIKNDGSDDASINGYEQWVRSAYFVKTGGAHSISLSLESFPRCYVFQYDDEHHFIASDKMDRIVHLLDNCSYIRLKIRASNTPSFVPVCFEYGYDGPCEEKKVQMSTPYDRLVYAVTKDIYTTALLMLPPNYSIKGNGVPLIIWDSGDGSFSSWDDHEMGAEGAPGRVTGLSFLRDSGFAVLEIFSWGSYYFQKYSGCGRRSAMPIPTHLATHERGVEYVLDRYNIDANNIYHVSKSGSGKIALYYAMVKPSFNLKAIYAFAPVFDDLNFVGWGMEGYRKALFEELDLQGTQQEIEYYLEGTPYDYDIEYNSQNKLHLALAKSWQMHKPLGRSFIARNAEKFKYVSVDWFGVQETTIEDCMSCTHRFSEMFWQGYNRHYNPEKRNFFFRWDSLGIPATRSNTYTRYHLTRQWSGIPFIVIMSPTDEQTPYWNALEVVKQLQNGGADARMITLETGGHSGPDLSVSGSNTKTDIITSCNVHYDNVSIGWYLAVNDIYERFGRSF